MKLKELKEKYQNNFSIRVIAGVLSIVLLGGSVGAYHYQEYKAVETSVEAQNNEKEKNEKDSDQKTTGAKSDEDEKDSIKKELTNKISSILSSDSDSKENLDEKEETVYLITDANGNVNQTIVSNWLKNGSGSAQIQDVSNLTDIENVKGDETFTQNGENITWQANGQDIYYRGTTTEELPISQKLTYYLDGVEIAPEELAGKSGKVTIRFDYENHAKTTAIINGKQEEIYVPFTVLSGMILNDDFHNVRVNHGRVISDGDKVVAVGFAMPGLKESLAIDEKDLDEDFEFPEYVEVTADVENFSLEMTATAAIAGMMSDSDFSENFDLKDLDDTVDELSDSMGKLKDGGSELADGLDTLHDSMGSFSDGVNTLRNGVNAYTDGAAQLAGGIQTLSDSSGALESGVNTINSSAKTISDGIQQLDSAVNTQMSEKEKAAVKKEVDKTIESQFKKGTDTYNMVYNAAVQNFDQTMTSETTVQTVQAGIQMGLASQGLTSDGVVAALAQYYAENGFTDASGQSYSAETCQSNVPGTETTYAAFFANAVLNGGLSSALAGGITGGIASQGSSAVGEAVVNACETAAKQAGETAAVSGAESAKKQIAAAIETPSGAGGYSLVTGSKALSDGTQQLANSIPTLKNGISQLLNGANELNGNNGALKDGVAKLADGTVQIADGVVKLDDGAHKLSDGLTEFDEKAISKLVDAYHGDLKQLVERMKEIVRAGEDYRTFSGASKDVSATTKFIFRTDGIKVKED